jgi:hypothetical protein
MENERHVFPFVPPPLKSPEGGGIPTFPRLEGSPQMEKVENRNQVSHFPTRGPPIPRSLIGPTRNTKTALDLYRRLTSFLLKSGMAATTPRISLPPLSRTLPPHNCSANEGVAAGTFSNLPKRDNISRRCSSKYGSTTETSAFQIRESNSVVWSDRDSSSVCQLGVARMHL